MRDNTPTARLESKPTYAPCDSCGAENGVIYHHPEGPTEHYCPRCAQRHALYAAAYDQLEAQVRETVKAWETIWGNLSSTPDFGELLGQIGHKLDEEHKEHR